MIAFHSSGARLRTACATLLAATCVAPILGAQAPATPARSGVHPTPPKSLPAVLTSRVVAVDGRLDEEAWQGVEPATDFVQSLPDEGKPATLRTEIRFVYDEEALYVGARMFDPLGARGVRSRMTRRDRTSEADSDMLTFTFDPFHDHLSRVLFEIAPSGVKGDGLGPGGVNVDYSWDPVWQVATSIDSLGWTAEARIPFSQMRYPRETVQTWGVQVVRYALRVNERSHWAFWTRQEAGGPSRFNHLDGLRITARPSRLELLPYVAGRSQHLGDDPGNPFAKDGVQDVRVGADLKYLLTSNLTLQATFNPDFGQVEADPAVVNLTQYENQFSERRPFFVEGAGIFSFGGFNCFFCSNVNSLGLFYSRRVGRAPQGFVTRGVYSDVPESATILGAGKITGRTSNGWTVGMMDAVTRREYAAVLDSVVLDEAGDTVAVRPNQFGQQVEPLSNYFVGRVKKDMRQGRLVVGGIATSVVRQLDDDFLRSRLPGHSESVGGDMDLWMRGRRYRLMGSAALTHVGGDSSAMLLRQRSSARYFQRPDRESAGGRGALFLDRLDSSATRMAGYGGILRLSKEEGSLLWETQANVRSPGFENNDIALLTRTDFVWHNANLFKQWTKPTRLYRAAYAIVGAQQQFNFDGDLTDRQYQVYGELELKNNWITNGYYIRRPSTYDDRLTRGGPVVRRSGNHNVSLFVQSDQRRDFSLSTNPNYGWSEAGTDGYYVNLFLTWRTPRVTFTAGPDYGKSSSPYQYVYAVDDPAHTEFYGRRYVFGALDQRTVSMSTRANITFSPDLTLELVATPFISAGTISRFREFDETRQEKRSIYGRDRGTIDVTGQGWDKTWTVDPDGGDPANSFSFSNRDIANQIGLPAEFNTRSLIGNAVLRWEYRPGSTLYAVWSHNRDSFIPFGKLDVVDDQRALFRAQPKNVFLVKANFWVAM
jgi:hypothetical protein